MQTAIEKLTKSVDHLAEAVGDQKIFSIKVMAVFATLTTTVSALGIIISNWDHISAFLAVK